MPEDLEFLYRLAVMYYTDGLNQQEISDQLGISRPQISRALARAQHEGIVRIELVPPESGLKQLESRLAVALGIDRVFVAPRLVKTGSARERHNQDIALCAARILPGLFAGKSVVGIGWGDTVYRTALALDHAADQGKTCFVPLIGSLGMREPRFQVNSIVDRIAEKMKSEGLYFNGPAFAADAQARENALMQKPFTSILATWGRLDLAVIGLGVSVEHQGFPSGEFLPENIENLRKAGAVGDILGQFFNAEGELCESGNEKEYLGINIMELKKVSQVVCLCGGTSKIPGIIAAAKQGFYSMLVTDVQTANELANTLEGKK